MSTSSLSLSGNASPLSSTCPTQGPRSPLPTGPEPTECPFPGTFKFLPAGTEVKYCSMPDQGKPGNHPVLVLPCTEGYDPLVYVDVVFTTTKDVVGFCKARSWAMKYFPLEGQRHPFRRAIPLAQGCAGFPKPTSINVESRYTVPWRSLRDVSFGCPGMLVPCLSPPVLDFLLEVVQSHEIRVRRQREMMKHTNPQVGAALITPITPLISAAPTAPSVALVAAPVTYASVAAHAPLVAKAYVPPHRREQGNGTKRNLSAEAVVFEPSVSKQRVHPAHSQGSWR